MPDPNNPASTISEKLSAVATTGAAAVAALQQPPSGGVCAALASARADAQALVDAYTAAMNAQNPPCNEI